VRQYGRRSAILVTAWLLILVVGADIIDNKSKYLLRSSNHKSKQSFLMQGSKLANKTVTQRYTKQHFI